MIAVKKIHTYDVLYIDVCNRWMVKQQDCIVSISVQKNIYP